MRVVALNAIVLLFIAAAAYHNVRKPGLSESDLLRLPLQIDSTRAENADEAELLLSRYAVGDSVRLSAVDPDGRAVNWNAPVVPYYSATFVFFKLVLVLTIFSLGAFVYFYRAPGMEALLFHIASSALSVSIAGAKTIYSVHPAWLGELLCGIFFLCYGLQAALFLHFTMHFPREKRKILRWIVPAYAAAIGVSLSGCIMYLRVSRGRQTAMLRDSFPSEAVLNALVVALLVAGVANFIHSYVTASDDSQKKKLRWVLFGLCVGPAPFIFFSALPLAFGSTPLVPESVMLGFLVILPATFAIAIVRHRILNIDFIINRSIVYGATLGALVLAAALLFGILAESLDGYSPVSSPVLLTVVSVFFALILQPLKRGVQEFVDRRFFLVRYNYRQTQRKLFDEIRRTFDAGQLAELIIRETQRILSVECIGFFTVNQATKRLSLVAHEHAAAPGQGEGELSAEMFASPFLRPVALESCVEPGLDVDVASPGLLERTAVALVLPCTAEDGATLGILALGRKKSGFRFLSEDIDLLSGVAAQAGLALQRILLQEKLILEHAETERLAKLNQLKSYFVASVTHDLKTPLTSIKLFAELLRTSESLTAKAKEEYLEIIEGESDRLTRMINNVLDFSMVERGTKTYHPVVTELRREVEGVLRSVSYQLKMEKFELERQLMEEPCRILLDKDAFAEALCNLISNAMKYSLQSRTIAVATFVRGRWAGVSVEDKGAGMSEEQVQHIFDQFYRVNDSRFRGVGGAGLGLSIVKHIMDAHGGKVEVKSALGAGSTFTLLFPTETADETNSDH